MLGVNKLFPGVGPRIVGAQMLVESKYRFRGVYRGRLNGGAVVVWTREQREKHPEVTRITGIRLGHSMFRISWVPAARSVAPRSLGGPCDREVDSSRSRALWNLPRPNVWGGVSVSAPR
jgi:hypothetical protein